jgi:uncharacterized RDD family membrane protein YckC
MSPRDNPYAAPQSELSVGLEPVHHDEPVPAEMGKRFGAYMIDTMLVAFVAMALFGVCLVVVIGLIPEDNQELAINLMSIFMQVAMIGGNTVYGALMESSGWQATLGKRAMGIVVVDEHGAPLTFGKALGRNLGKWVLLSMCGLLALSPLFESRRRGVWDQIAKTMVVPRFTLDNL